MTQRPLYGLLVIGELPHEADARTTAARQAPAAPPPGGSGLMRRLSRWLRKMHATLGRSD